MEIVYKDESYRIMGACFEVYKEMGCGFVEPVYQNAWRWNWPCKNCRFWRNRRYA